MGCDCSDFFINKKASHTPRLAFLSYYEITYGSLYHTFNKKINNRLYLLW